eukprot:TRINITY_DN2316_c0_g2_i1.p1 TRINITY_DN2316_c0_g2~~TRINITY_DN2316_c0_g2_i1.p1  ORF type:complete len:551 (-),score=77.20 TRINITY_DN2316_c0_g2_i1:412-2064(-)
MDPKAFEVAMEQMRRMTPEQLAQIQEQARNMSPEMQQAAMQQMQNMSGADWSHFQSAAQNISPEQLTSQSRNASSQFEARQKYVVQGGQNLKEEGNQLHKQGKYKAAVEKYEQALKNVENVGNGSEAMELRKACRLNLASCYLKLDQNSNCVKICADILQVDRDNMKALYRRGQALGNLGRYSEAVSDLKQASRLVGNDPQQLSLIQEKIDLFSVRIRTQDDECIIEEIHEPSSSHMNQDNNAGDNDYDKEHFEQILQSSNQSEDDVLDAALKMKDDPQLFEKFQEMLSQQTDEQIEAQLKSFGMSNVSQEMIDKTKQGVGNLNMEQFAQATEKLKDLPPEKLQQMMKGFKMPKSQMPQLNSEQMNMAVNMMKDNPDLFKRMSETMSQVPPEQIRQMSSASQSPGIPNDPGMMATASKLMANMSPEDLQKMTKLATSAKAAGSNPENMAASMMQDPQMMEQALSMMQNMNEDDLAQMFKQMNPGMSDDVAKGSAQQMKKLSQGQMKMLLQAQQFVQKLGTYKSTVFSRTGIIITLIILLLAIGLRYLGIL